MPDTEVERRGPVLIFRVLKGEWWNHLRPGAAWLMEHDSVEYPPAQWHLDLRALPESEIQEADRIIIDMTACNNMTGQDMSEIVEFARPHNRRLALVASEPVVQAWTVFRRFDAFPSLHTTIDDALRPPPPREETLAIRSISAVTLATSDMARSVRFYQALGFTLRYGGEDASFTSFTAGSSYLNLTANDSGHNKASWGRVIFYVSDVDALHRHAIAQGRHPETTPCDAPWGERYFHITDPDGHGLSFAKPL